MRNLFFYLIIASSLFATTAHSQNYNFINYTISDGLAHEKITDITEDTFGNLWIATLGGGLSCFNGIEFKNYTEKDGLSNNIVRQITVDNLGNVWAATSNGISVFNGVSFKNFLVDTLQSMASVNVISSDSDGNIWFSHPSGGLGKVSPSGVVEKIALEGWKSNDKIIDIECRGDGRVYFVTAIQGLFVFENDDWSTVFSNTEFKGYLLDFQFQGDSTIVLGSNKGLVLLDVTDKREVELKWSGSFVTSSTLKNEDERWLISGGRAFRVLNNKLTLINKSNGFTDFPISRIYCDREQNIWFATEGDGIIKLGNDIFQFYDQSHGLFAQPITSICQDENSNFYLASFGAGVQVMNSAGALSILDNTILTHVTSSTLDQDGNIWFGTRNQGVVKYDGNSLKQYGTDQGLVSQLVRVMFADKLGRLWIGTANGISIYENENFKNVGVQDGLPDGVVWAISEPKDDSILITTRKGLCRYVGDSLELINLDQKLFENRINTALLDKMGNYWLGYSGHGIVKTRPGLNEYESFTTESGLSSNLIYNLLFDDNNDLVVGSERGVDKIFLDEQYHLNRIKSYGKVEGLYGIRTLYNSSYLDGRGDIWFGNSQGLIRYQGQYEKLNTQAPITYISALALDYEVVDWSQEANSLNPLMKVPQKVDLTYNENNIIFSYFGNSLTNPEAVNYQYRLVGLDQEWSPFTKKREAVFTNLSPGEYTFQVRASNSDGVWSKNPAQIDINIIPPFWQEAWFYVLVGIAFMLLIKLFNDYRIKKNLDKVLTVERIRAEELVKVRKRMARDFHDNMGNQLASITVFTNLIGLKLKDKSSEINDLLSNIEKHTKSLFNGTKDFIWSIDPESDNLNEIFTYIKDFGEELFENTTIDFYSSTKEIGDLPLPSGWSRQIVLIFKEAMTNALKHSNGSQVHLELNQNQSEFVIRVWDNGSDTKLDSAKLGNGFRNMRSRAQQIGGSLEISQGENNIGIVIEFKAIIQSELK